MGGQPLHMLSGSERIDAGSWDAALAGRDYFIARLPEEALVWLYRERPQLERALDGWFLQGRFAWNATPTCDYLHPASRQCGAGANHIMIGPPRGV